MGDQRRRSKSKGCQKEQVEGEEGEVCGWVYTERAWLLLRVHSREGTGAEGGHRRRTTGEGCRREAKEAVQRKKRKEQMTDEMSR